MNQFLGEAKHMKLYEEDIVFFKELISSDLVDIYGIHLKYRLSPFQIVRFIDKYQGLGLIHCKENTICLTKSGQNWLFANRNYILLQRHKIQDNFTEKFVIDNGNKKIKFDKSIYRLLGQKN